MLIKNIVSLVKEYPPVRPKKKSTSGKKPIHSWEKLICICILMVVFGSTYRNIQNVVPSLNLPWNEPCPDHTWISRTFKKIPMIYLECILLSSAYLCLKESEWLKGILASDSTGVETDRYDYEVRLVILFLNRVDHQPPISILDWSDEIEKWSDDLVEWRSHLEKR